MLSSRRVLIAVCVGFPGRLVRLHALASELRADSLIVPTGVVRLKGRRPSAENSFFIVGFAQIPLRQRGLAHKENESD